MWDAPVVKQLDAASFKGRNRETTETEGVVRSHWLSAEVHWLV